MSDQSSPQGESIESGCEVPKPQVHLSTRWCMRKLPGVHALGSKKKRSAERTADLCLRMSVRTIPLISCFEKVVADKKESAGETKLLKSLH